MGRLNPIVEKRRSNPSLGMSIIFVEQEQRSKKANKFKGKILIFQKTSAEGEIKTGGDTKRGR